MFKLAFRIAGAAVFVCGSAAVADPVVTDSNISATGPALAVAVHAGDDLGLARSHQISVADVRTPELLDDGPAKGSTGAMLMAGVAVMGVMARRRWRNRA